MLWNLLTVAGGGALGSICRYLISLGIGRVDGHPLLATFLANVLGSFIIGCAMSRAEGRTALFLTVGFCGGFTTFSTFSAQTLDLIGQGLWLPACGYALGSVISCVVAVLAALALCR